MAKGRKLTTSWSDRYLDSYSSRNRNAANGTGATEFCEEDVWSMVDDAADQDQSSEDIDSSPSEWSPRSPPAGRSSGRRRIAIHRRDDSRLSGGLSFAFEDPALSSPRVVHQFRGTDGAGGGRSMKMASSAPVNVPDWNKIYRADSAESMHDSDEEPADSEMVPPHEYLARSRKMLATSVFEGQGRTLKGRDMSRVRDAVWNRTGFDG